MKRIVMGIVAHVDSGKTTLSEALLYQTGALKEIGRVDHKNTLLDSDTIERERGITIFAKQALIQIQDMQITLLDTPGHVDFSAETERTLAVLDCAVLVISGTDGVQSHTETLWKLLARHGIPTVIFVNKMDITEQSKAQLLANLRERLSPQCADFCDDTESGTEQIALSWDKLTEEYLDSGKISDDTVADAVERRMLFPCFFGSALKLGGLDELINALPRYIKPHNYSEDFGAIVYKISTDDSGNRLTHIKVTGGSIRVRDTLQITDRTGAVHSEKITRIRSYQGDKYSEIQTAEQGSVVVLIGLVNTYAGMPMGNAKKPHLPVLEPVMTYRVILPPNIDAHTAYKKLQILEEQDPTLNIVWNSTLQEIQLRLMGEIQLEIIREISATRLGMELDFDTGNILYRETVTAPVIGVGHFEPLRHYAEVHLLIEPADRGSGITLASTCSEDTLDRNFQHLVFTHLAEKIHRGTVIGAPITDVRITLVTGRAHLKHTESGDFREATYRALRQGLRSTDVALLEPYYSFTLTLPQENVGRAMSDIQRFCGSFEPPVISEDTATLTGSAPVATLQGYQPEINSYTRGRGKLVCTPCGYSLCHNTAEIREKVGYNIDSDIQNTADSVFCSHGAGFTVKWNEVRKYCHLESGIEGEKQQQETAEATRRRVSAYCGTLEEDKELLAIFERTYGKVKRDMHTAFAPTQSREKKAHILEDIDIVPEYLLVDGYNIIFAWDELKKLAQQNIDAARHRLMNMLCNYQGVRGCKLILVFDAYKVKGQTEEVELFHNITVVYTKEAETADMYIEKTTQELGRKQRVRVATSDSVEQLIILGHGATRVSAPMFEQEVRTIEQAIRDYLK